MRKKSKIAIFAALMALLWLPLLQEKFNLFKQTELNGAFVKPYKPSFSMDSLNSLEFQNQYEKYKNANFGFRPFLIRWKNSINYIFFKELSINDNIAGKDNFIFSLGSTERTLGIRYNGKQKNGETVEKIKLLQEGIESHGGHILVVIAPSKESVIPDMVPRPYNRNPEENTDYKDLIEGYRSKNIPYLDYVVYFNQLKQITQYPLFTKTGFHWSVYGASLAHDTLIRFMEKALGKSLLGYRRNGIEISDTAREPDADFEGPLNLLFSLGQPPYYYPKLEMLNDTKNRFRPKVIIIGDSFFWQLKNQKMMMHIFSEDSKFWYYFATNSFPIGDIPAVPLKDIDIMNELQTADYVLLVGNISTLDAFPYGVANYYSEHINGFSVIAGIREGIKSNPGLMKKINTVAAEQKKSIEDAISSEAQSICVTQEKVNLKGFNNKYACAGGSDENLIFVNRDNAYLWETFSMVKFNEHEVAFFSYKNKFLSAELGSKTEITGTRNLVGAWETFTVVKVDSDHVAFKAFNGKYLSLDINTGKIYANAASIGKNEKFKLEKVK